jgi:serine acetyltransferase
MTNEAIGRLNSKLDSSVQLTNEAVSKLDSKLDGNMRTVSETISKLDEKLDGTLQTTNGAIGELYREKLSVQEFREFVNVFNKVLGESFPLPDAIVPQISEPAARQSNGGDRSGFQGETITNLEEESGAPRNTEATPSSQAGVEVTSPQIIVETPSSKASEKASLPPKSTVGKGVNKHVGFPMKVVGESFYVGDGVTSIVGDVEIPPGTTVDETLVVKGNFRSRECCRLLSNVKALKDIEIGDDTTVEGNLVSGGRVTVNSNCIVKGSIESEGNIEIGENVIVEENLSSKSSVVLSESAQVLRTINAAKGILRPRAGQRA